MERRMQFREATREGQFDPDGREATPQELEDELLVKAKVVKCPECKTEHRVPKGGKKVCAACRDRITDSPVVQPPLQPPGYMEFSDGSSVNVADRVG